jgi:sarcosine oxidase subunit beta
MSNAVHVYVSQAHKGELVLGAGIDPYNSFGQRGSFHVLEHQLAAALELFPQFERVRMVRAWAGAVDVTPDASPVIGPTAIAGLYVNCGWGTGGFKATPGAGDIFAHTIAADSVHPLAAPFDIDRFISGRIIDEHGAAGVAH